MFYKINAPFTNPCFTNPIQSIFYNMPVGVYYSLSESMLALLKEIINSTKEIGLLKWVSDRDMAKMFSSTKHLIAMTSNAPQATEKDSLTRTCCHAPAIMLFNWTHMEINSGTSGFT